MRISKVAKKSMAVAMAMAVAVGSVAVAPTKDASAAKAKSKKVNARVYFAGNAKGADCLWIAGDSSNVILAVEVEVPSSAPPVALKMPVGFPLPSPMKNASSSLEPILLANSFAM